jgi:putative flippase GtrA
MMMVRQLFGYIAVGLAQLALEWGLFVAATSFAMPVPVANVLARIAGASVGFWLNGRFTFAASGAVVGRRALFRFAMSWLALTIIGTTLVSCLEAFGGLRAAWIGKPLVDIVLAGAGFLASKYWIYRSDYPKGQS